MFARTLKFYLFILISYLGESDPKGHRKRDRHGGCCHSAIRDTRVPGRKRHGKQSEARSSTSQGLSAWTSGCHQEGMACPSSPWDLKEFCTCSPAFAHSEDSSLPTPSTGSTISTLDAAETTLPQVSLNSTGGKQGPVSNAKNFSRAQASAYSWLGLTPHHSLL